MSHHRVIARVFGGIGNQLFIYAASRRLALVNQAELVLDDVSGFRFDPYRRQYELGHFHIPCRTATSGERLEPLAKLRRYLLRTQGRAAGFASSRYVQEQGIDFDQRLLGKRVSGTLRIEGYWQSYKYFSDVEPLIRQELQIIPPQDAVNQRLACEIRDKTSVAVHVRFFDAPEAGVDNNTPADYYSKAIKELNSRVPDAHFYIFSDRPTEARALIPLPDQRMTVITHNKGDENAFADLWLMTHCKHFVIANSTFSWWGAWLSGHQAKCVIAPGFVKRHGVSSWGFDGLLPDDWIRL